MKAKIKELLGSTDLFTKAQEKRVKKLATKTANRVVDTKTKPYRIADEGDLINQLKGAAEDRTDEHQSKVVAKGGAVFDPGKTIHVPRNVVLDMSGATVCPSSSYDVFTYGVGARVLNADVCLYHVDDYRGSVHLMDPQYVDDSYFGREKIATEKFIDERAQDVWMAGDERIRQNHYGADTGPRGGNIRAKFGQNVVGMHFRATADLDVNHVRHYMVMAKARAHMDRVAYPVVLEANHSDNALTAIDCYVKARSYRQGITIKGNEGCRRNNITVDLQPRKGFSECGAIIDNPKARHNVIRGWIWDPAKISGPSIWQKSTKDENCYVTHLPKAKWQVNHARNDTDVDLCVRDSVHGDTYTV